MNKMSDASIRFIGHQLMVAGLTYRWAIIAQEMLRDGDYQIGTPLPSAEWSDSETCWGWRVGCEVAFFENSDAGSRLLIVHPFHESIEEEAMSCVEETAIVEAAIEEEDMSWFDETTIEETAIEETAIEEEEDMSWFDDWFNGPSTVS